MKNTLLFFACFCLTTLSACKKRNKNPVSTWSVNGESFSTNDVGIDKGKVILDYRTTDQTNGFFFEFEVNYFRQDNFPLGCTSDPYYVCVRIFYNKISYSYISQLKPISYMRTTVENNKAIYNIDSMWFFNENNPTDSVLIKGVFKEP